MLTGVKPDLASAVTEAEARYRTANPKSLAQFKRAGRYLPGGNTRIALHYDPFPIVLRHAEHSRVHDLDGHVYIDFMNDLTAGFYGHSHPVILEAINETLAGGISFGGPSIHEDRLAEAICRRFASIEKVRFCNSGTEANLIALQLARAVTGRSKVLAFTGGYHGSVLSFVAGLASLNVDGVQLASFNHIESVKAVAATAGSQLAAIIVEPLMGSGGTIMADRHFLADLRRIATELGALLIFDEVQTARLAHGGLQEVFGIHPDLTTLGKFVGGGLAFGAFGGRAEVMDHLDPGRTDRIGHGGTFNNNVLTMAAGTAGLQRIATREAINDLNRQADRLRDKLQAAANSRGVPLQPKGYGSIVSMHFQTTEPKRPDDIKTSPLLRELIHLELLLTGFYVTRRGTINLSLASTEVDCDAFAEAMGAIFDQYRQLFRESQ
jgi:glutamate-1-semialdehyde 2,1-aminomutase